MLLFEKYCLRICLLAFNLQMDFIKREKSSIFEMKLLAIEAICLIEKEFPTSIMDIQLHLIVHLADEVAYVRTWHGRWMFSLECFMKVLKGYVRKKARPKGSMVE